MSDTVRIRPSYGWWEIVWDCQGKVYRTVWHHNPNLPLSREEQNRLNEENGYAPQAQAKAAEEVTMPLGRFDRKSYDQGYGDGHIKGFERGEECSGDERRRVEALRVAGHIVAEWQGGDPNAYEHTAVAMAKRFVTYLETGE